MSLVWFTNLIPSIRPSLLDTFNDIIRTENAQEESRNKALQKVRKAGNLTGLPSEPLSLQETGMFATYCQGCLQNRKAYAQLKNRSFAGPAGSNVLDLFGEVEGLLSRAKNTEELHCNARFRQDGEGFPADFSTGLKEKDACTRELYIRKLIVCLCRIICDYGYYSKQMSSTDPTLSEAVTTLNTYASTAVNGIKTAAEYLVQMEVRDLFFTPEVDLRMLLQCIDRFEQEFKATRDNTDVALRSAGISVDAVSPRSPSISSGFRGFQHRWSKTENPPKDEAGAVAVRGVLQERMESLVTVCSDTKRSIAPIPWPTEYMEYTPIPPWISNTGDPDYNRYVSETQSFSKCVENFKIQSEAIWTEDGVPLTPSVVLLRNLIVSDRFEGVKRGNREILELICPHIQRAVDWDSMGLTMGKMIEVWEDWLKSPFQGKSIGPKELKEDDSRDTAFLFRELWAKFTDLARRFSVIAKVLQDERSTRLWQGGQELRVGCLMPWLQGTWYLFFSLWASFEKETIVGYTKYEDADEFKVFIKFLALLRATAKPLLSMFSEVDDVKVFFEQQERLTDSERYEAVKKRTSQVNTLISFLSQLRGTFDSPLVTPFSRGAFDMSMGRCTMLKRFHAPQEKPKDYPALDKLFNQVEKGT